MLTHDACHLPSIYTTTTHACRYTLVWGINFVTFMLHVAFILTFRTLSSNWQLVALALFASLDFATRMVCVRWVPNKLWQALFSDPSIPAESPHMGTPHAPVVPSHLRLLYAIFSELVTNCFLVIAMAQARDAGVFAVTVAIGLLPHVSYPVAIYMSTKIHDQTPKTFEQRKKLILSWMLMSAAEVMTWVGFCVVFPALAYGPQSSQILVVVEVVEDGGAVTVLWYSLITLVAELLFGLAAAAFITKLAQPGEESLLSLARGLAQSKFLVRGVTTCAALMWWCAILVFGQHFGAEEFSRALLGIEIYG